MENDDDELPARRMSGLDLVIAVWALISTMLDNLSMFGEHVTRLLVMHRNYTEDQRGFADAVRDTLESIPTTKE